MGEKEILAVGPGKPKKFKERLEEIGKLQEEIKEKKLNVKPKNEVKNRFTERFNEMDKLL